MDEKYRLSGKKLFLTYPINKIYVNELIIYLESKFNNKIINYILVGIKKTKLHVFISVEKIIDFRSKDCLNFNGIEGEYIISTDVSLDILRILQSDDVKIQGDFDHPVYLLHKIKEKEKEKEFREILFLKEKELVLKEKEFDLKKKENEIIRNEFQTKLNENKKEFALKENEFIHKLQEKENELVLKEKEIELLKFKEDFMNKSHERIKSQNENLMNSFLNIKENIKENQTENRFDNMLNNISDASDFLAVMNDEFKKINEFSENDELFENENTENKENYSNENNKDCLNQSK
jgi:hypothetical protein